MPIDMLLVGIYIWMPVAMCLYALWQVYRELPLQERLMARRAHRCPLCAGNPIASLQVGFNELVETVSLIT